MNFSHQTLALQENRFLSEFSTFGIGGKIRYLCEIRTSEEAESAYAWAKKENLPLLILGKGSNSLFQDAPFEGLVLLNKIDFCSIENGIVKVGAGYSFSLLGSQTARQGLTGLEFASGIPASVGGAIFMNAGANGQETFGPLIEVSYLLTSGEKKLYKKEDLSYGYRTSSFQTMQGMILSASFGLKPHVNARKEQLKLIDYRMKTQPYKDKSVGCVFRNPAEGVSAGALIDRCQLKGLKVGGAEVSSMHANFIINAGGATAQDVKALITLIQKKVYEQTGHQLEPEIRILP